jgi:hypothetical protein
VYKKLLSNNKKKALGELRFDGNEENEYMNSTGIKALN